MKKLIGIILVSFVILITVPTYTLAHPGNTDSSGYHTCRTNCPSWGYSYGEYHTHASNKKTAPIPTNTESDDDGSWIWWLIGGTVVIGYTIYVIVEAKKKDK